MEIRKAKIENYRKAFDKMLMSEDRKKPKKIRETGNPNQATIFDNNGQTKLNLQ